ncbi:MAG: phosphoglycerate dehydrogenase, partial [Deltaproteobacteria bacterium]|nr:phosphoglycerate dehydrogenase [Deltaproteobacteria bacterium]
MKVLVADKLDEAAIAKMRDAGLDVTVKVGLSPDALFAEISAYDAIAIRSATKVTKDVIAAGKNLKLIVRAGIGLDNVDVAAAEAQGITVRNTPAATTISVAEHTMALLLALLRHIPQAHVKLEEGFWEKTAFTGNELYEKTLGVIGFGKIGQEVAKRALAFSMKVVAIDPIVSPDVGRKMGVPFATLDDLLKQSDVVTLHLPLNA